MADVDLELAINRLQAKNRAISGVTLAPDLGDYRASVEDVQLPYVITWPADGEWAIKGHGWKTDHRTMLVIAFVQPLGQGLIPTRAQQAVRLLQAMRSYYITAANITLADSIPDGYQITIESGPNISHTDEGLRSDLEIGGRTYHGFMLRVHVRLQWQ